ncbi:MAG: transcriptional regulator [Litorilinea sp.]|nr:MAG: transcriptional regulator [Litorilinea sp.]
MGKIPLGGPLSHCMATLLVVDDNRYFLHALNRLLTTAGHTVLEASDVATALEILTAEPDGAGVEVLITDILMPQRDGIQLIRELKRSNRRIKIIAITGGGYDNELAEDVLAAAQILGVDLALQKPFDPQLLLDTLERLTDSPSSADPS